MSICVELNVKGEPVLIVGGGKVALRKARQFSKEGAIVTVVAKEMIEGIAEAAAITHQRGFRSEDLDQQRLVIVASDDAGLNEQILAEAKQRGIWSMAVQKQSASMRSMSARHDPDYTIAVSTRGAFPLLASSILRDFNDVMRQTYAPRLKELRYLREAILKQGLDAGTKEKALCYVSSYTLDQLQFFTQAIKLKQASILVFHGVQEDTTLQELTSWRKQLQEDDPHTGYGYAFMSESIVKKVNDPKVNVFSHTELVWLLSLFSVSITLHPMFLTKGRYYQRLLAQAKTSSCRMCTLPFSDQASVSSLLKHIYDQYHEGGKECIITLHSCEDDAFLKHCEQAVRQLPLTSCCVDKELRHKDVKNVTLCPLFMLHGQHATIDPSHRISCVSDPWIRQLLHRKILTATASVDF